MDFTGVSPQNRQNYGVISVESLPIRPLSTPPTPLTSPIQIRRHQTWLYFPGTSGNFQIMPVISIGVSENIVFGVQDFRMDPYKRGGRREASRMQAPPRLNHLLPRVVISSSPYRPLHSLLRPGKGSPTRHALIDPHLRFRVVPG